MTSYEQKIDDLKKRVEEHSRLPLNFGENKAKVGFQSTLITFISTHIFKIYLLVPVIVLILLVMIRPRFITIQTKDSNNNDIYKLNSKKLLVSSLIVSCIGWICLFYFLKNNI